MVQEIPRKHESDAQENSSLNKPLSASSELDKIWPCCKADADNQRELLSRYTLPGISKDLLPPLLALTKDKAADSTKSDNDAGSINKRPENVLRTADAQNVLRTADTQNVLHTSDNQKSEVSNHEKLNANGSRLLLNDDNTIAKLTRKDGSSVDITYNNGKQTQIVDSNKDGTARTVWTQNSNGLWQADCQVKDQAGKWASDGKQGREYRSVTVEENGVTTAIDLVGFHFVTTPAGEKLDEGANYTFDDKGRIASISYEPSANRVFSFHYDENDKLDKVEFRNSEGKLQQTRAKTADGEWKVTNKDGSTAGTWTGAMEIAKNGNFREQDAKDKSAGIWQVTAPYEKFVEKISSDGQRISRIYSDKSEFEFEKNGDKERILKVTRGKDTREFRYDADGKLAQLIESTAGGTQVLNTDGMLAKIGSAGELSLATQDGSTIVKRANFSTEERDKDGNILKVTNKDGKARAFEYETVNNQKQLLKITNSTPGKDGASTEVWTRVKNADGSLSSQFVSSGGDGKQKAIAQVDVLYNGDYRLNPQTAKIVLQD